jgi:hypothetical protein
MERYRSNSGRAAFVGFIGIALLVIAIWLARQAAPEFTRANLLTLAAGIFILLTFLGTGLMCLFVAGGLGASYYVDDRGITRKSLRRATTIDWSDLDRFDETLPTELDTRCRYDLYARDGRRIVIPMSSVSDADGLRSRLEPHLAPLREQAARELAKYGRSWRPDRISGLVVLGFMAPICLIFGLHGLLGWPGTGHGWETSAPLLGMIFAVVAQVLAVLGVELNSRELTASDSSIALRSLFLDRKISLVSVESVTLRTDPDAPRFARAKIRGDGRSITIHSNMPGYREVIDLVRSRSDVEPLRAWDVSRPKEGSPRRPLRRAMGVMGPMFMFAGFSFMLTGGWRFFWARTAAGDEPAAALIRIGAALSLASVGLAIISHHRGSSAKAKVPEL